MPAKSKAQRKLFGMANAVANGDKKLSDFPVSLQKKIKSITGSMSNAEISKYAKSKEKKLPKKLKESVTLTFIEFLSLES